MVHGQLAYTGESVGYSPLGFQTISFDTSRREDSEREDPVRVSLVKIPYFIVVSPDEVHIHPRKSEDYGLIDTGLVHVLDYLFSRGQLGFLR
jgi:hypothetical protein